MGLFSGLSKDIRTAMITGLAILGTVLIVGVGGLIWAFFLSGTPKFPLAVGCVSTALLTWLVTLIMSRNN
jgi:hypothetical protein